MLFFQPSASHGVKRVLCLLCPHMLTTCIGTPTALRLISPFYLYIWPGYYCSNNENYNPLHIPNMNSSTPPPNKRRLHAACFIFKRTTMVGPLNLLLHSSLFQCVIMRIEFHTTPRRVCVYTSSQYYAEQKKDNPPQPCCLVQLYLTVCPRTERVEHSVDIYPDLDSSTLEINIFALISIRHSCI